MIDGGLYLLAVNWLQESLTTLRIEEWQRQKLLAKIESARHLATIEKSTTQMSVPDNGSKVKKQAAPSPAPLPIQKTENADFADDFDFLGR
jgi:hypothetical protein